MSEQEREPTKVSDSEVKALAFIQRLFDGLDRAAVSRILKWAEDRYVTTSYVELDPDFMNKFTAAITEAARKIGDVTPLDIITAVEEMHRLRAERESDQETVTAPP